ncbi:MAG: poly-beta-1,6-N-acetyl-D-glucosamine biosynthesis protein PgaD [Gammaproteobacteria bacterium]|nr:MAG: poly-beta-1,6-N-acetyl-D-glucosamine biosynthesis protein PgaD [Gammaproteobacteria bacterium]
MDQSGSRYRLRELIIEDKAAVTWPRKLTELSVSTFFWAIWVALWIPLISFLAWLFGVRLLSTSIWEAKDYSLQITIVLAAMTALLVVFNWSLYSSFFRHNAPKRPHMVYHSGTTQTNEFFEFDSQDASQLMESEVIRFGFQQAQETPSFVLMIDGQKVIKKNRQSGDHD